MEIPRRKDTEMREWRQARKSETEMQREMDTERVAEKMGWGRDRNREREIPSGERRGETDTQRKQDVSGRA